MHVLGCDSSSKSGGLALVDGDHLLASAVWTPPKGATRPAALLDCYDSMLAWIVALDYEIDLAIIESLSVTRGWKTVRALSHFEAATYMALQRCEIPMREVKPGAARNWVLGMKITSSKEEVHIELKTRYPNLKLPAINRGGGDVADAFVLGMSGPEVLRRGAL